MKTRTLITICFTAAMYTPAVADTPAKPAAGPKCRAVDAGKTITESAAPTTQDCSFALREDVKKHFCKAGSKGKTFTFTVEFDHKLGAKKWPAAKDRMFCAKEVE